MRKTEFKRVVGVDFSGAKRAGENAWVAQCLVVEDKLNLVSVNSLESLCGSALREPALAWLAEFSSKQDETLVGMDFPFGLPIELGWTTWPDQMRAVGEWQSAANDFGRECVRRARLVGEKMHIRRLTDRLTKTPFDCYHYRIIYQTFHGMRDVLGPLSKVAGVSIFPFQPVTESTRAVVVEACPGSTLKRWKLPHQNYKQPGGGALLPRRLATRNEILDGLSDRLKFSESQRRTMVRNPGGDAMDAAIAAAGAWEAFCSIDPAEIRKDARFPEEGMVLA